MKKVFRGWCYKKQTLDNIIFWDEFENLGTYIFKTRGQKDDWADLDLWPPKRVTVTVEVEY
jgi:hypothetical protein